MQDINQHLAHSLKQLRRQHGWSLDKAALETGVSKAMLGQIERGESSPTVSTLWKIATGFRTSFSRLLSSLPEALDEPLFRSVEESFSPLPGDTMQVAPLFPFDSRFGFELFELTLPPDTQSLSDAHEAGVVEHVIVLAGQLDVLLEGNWRTLKKGEAVRFSADRPHGYRNLKKRPAVFHDLICYPGERE